MTLKNLLGEEWYSILAPEFEQDYMKYLCHFVNKRREEVTVYPPKEEVFTAYRLTPYSKVKVCIIGQDPYINESEAHGLAFSTGNGRATPSLRQIEKTIRTQVYNENEDYVWNNNLTRWSDQGVILLNKVLTVDAKSSNSHKGKGWEHFILKTIEELDKKGDVIFLLWGKEAQALKSILKSKYIECEHPVAGSYQGRLWNNNDCFNKANELLTEKIIW